MAKQQGKIYLGYEEETVSEKNQTLLNYTVNKIGGFPDWPPLDNIQFPSKCQLCGLHRLLVVQCYAPLENSVYHRTLYVFACINPNCWIQSESWICVRSQYQDNTTKQSSTIVNMPTVETNLSWCTGADEWDENDNGDTANGNFMSVDNAPSPINGMHRNSDEDEESNSLEVETVEQALGNLHVFDAHNANMSPVQGAVGAVGVPVAAAELEGGDEPGLVSVDTPTAANSDIEALLHQKLVTNLDMPDPMVYTKFHVIPAYCLKMRTKLRLYEASGLLATLKTAELPQDIRSRLMCAPMQFVPKYIYVEEECHKAANHDDRVTELLNKYTKENELDVCAGGGGGGAGGDEEPYEEAAPLHGDRLFHAFLARLRENPGQILRYSVECAPLLGAPLRASAGSPESPAPRACARCGARLAAELQLLPGFAAALAVHSAPSPALQHLHFLSVLVFTCAQSCWQPGDALVPETVVFQPEVV